MAPDLIDAALRPLRSALRLMESDVAKPLERTEGEAQEAADAIHRMAASIEKHVKAIDELATSVGPLTESVDQLTSTMHDLVSLLAPMASAEHEVQRAEHEAAKAERFFGFRRHKSPPAAGSDPNAS